MKARTCCAVVLFALASLVACGSGNGIGSPLASGSYATCRQACIDHATPDCTTKCESACYGLCEGNMSSNNFPYVDRISCDSNGVTFYEGGTQMTCTP